MTFHCLPPLFFSSVSDNGGWHGRAGFVSELQDSSAAQSKRSGRVKIGPMIIKNKVCVDFTLLNTVINYFNFHVHTDLTWIPLGLNVRQRLSWSKTFMRFIWDETINGKRQSGSLPLCGSDRHTHFCVFCAKSIISQWLKWSSDLLLGLSKRL